MIHFAKAESIGNDFVIVEAPAESRADFAELAVALCDRRFGVGSDGLLVLARGTNDRFAMRMFNPDGTEDFCGNGLRCAAVYAAERGWIGSTFTIEHGGQSVACDIDGTSVTTTLAAASFEPAAVPFEGQGEFVLDQIEVDGEQLLATALTTGSTHLIIPGSQLPGHDRFARLSSKLEHHSMFPARTSVIWLRADGDDDLTIRIWERGVGETMGCGTGSAAAAVSYARSQGRAGRFQVHNPGGTVLVALDHGWQGPIAVTGAARILFEGDVPQFELG